MYEDNVSMLPYFKAKLALRHSDWQPAILRDASFGRVKRFYTQMRKGLLRLYADFERVPEVVAKAIRYFYPERSVEIPYVTVHPNTYQVYTNIISAVAFLGRIPPEVKGMLDEFAAITYQQSDVFRRVRPMCFSHAMHTVRTSVRQNMDVLARLRASGLTLEQIVEKTGIVKERLESIHQGAQMLSEEDQALQALLPDPSDPSAPSDSSEPEDQNVIPEGTGEASFEQGVRVAGKLYQAELAKRDARIEALERRNVRSDIRTRLFEMKSDGLPAVFSGEDMVEFVSSLSGTRVFSAGGKQTNQVEYMFQVLGHLKKIKSVPVNPSGIDDDKRGLREFEQRGLDEAQALIEAVQKELKEARKPGGYTEGLIEAATRRPDLFQ